MSLAQLNKELKTTNIIWQLNDLYPATDHPDIDRDITICTREAEQLNREYSNKIGTLTAPALLILVSKMEKLAVKLARLSTFAFLNFATKTKEATSSAFLQKITEVSSRINKEIVFFELEWNQLETTQAEKLLQAPELTHYRHYLANMLRYSPHLLTRAEESLLLEKAPVSRNSWILLFEKVMGHLKFGKTQRSEEEVLSDLYNPNRQVRKQASQDLTDGLQSQLHILTHITNTLLADKMIDDSLRKYSSWLSSMNLYNEVEDQTVDILVDTITSRYDIVRKFYNNKKNILGLDKLFDYDRYAPLPNLPDHNISWDECRHQVIEAFSEFSPELAEIGNMFFDKNWIHAPILDGKRGGAFAHPCIAKVHPYIMVNYTGNIRDVSTVAHELGHGIHQYLAGKLGHYNSSTPLVLAETASVFAELITFKHQLGLIEDQKTKNAFIGQKIESIFATVFRQIAMNRFEDLSHNARRDKGELPQEKLSEFWGKTQKEMFGDSINLTDNYSIWWSYIPHFLNSPGYVYSYAFGELLVLSLYRIFQEEGSSFTNKYIDLLKAGGSDSPENIVKPFGIDLQDPLFWHGGLCLIDEMVDMMGADD